MIYLYTIILVLIILASRIYPLEASLSKAKMGYIRGMANPLRALSQVSLPTKAKPEEPRPAPTVPPTPTPTDAFVPPPEIDFYGTSCVDRCNEPEPDWFPHGPWGWGTYEELQCYCDGHCLVDFDHCRDDYAGVCA